MPPRYQPYKLAGVEKRFTGAKRHAVLKGRELITDGAIRDRGSLRYCLLLQGDFGTGKTTLATALLKEAMWKRDRPGRWMKFYAFVRHVQSGYSDGTADAKLREVQQIPLLLLDDVGDVERSKAETDDRRALLYEVLDYRNDYLLPTILTTNLSVAGLIEQFSERTFERILEMCALIEIGGENLRLHANGTTA